MFSKLLFWAIALALFAKLLVLPRFHVWKQKLDRVVNAILVALVLVYGGQLLLLWTTR